MSPFRRKHRTYKLTRVQRLRLAAAGLIGAVGLGIAANTFKPPPASIRPALRSYPPVQEKKFPTAPRHPRDVPSALPRPIPGIQKKVFTAPRTFRPTRKQRNIVVQGYSPFEMQNPNYWLQFSSIWNYHSNKKQGWQSLARFDDLLMVRVEKTRKVSGKRKWELGYAVYLGTSPEGSVLLRWLTEPNESPPEYFEVRRIFRPLWK